MNILFKILLIALATCLSALSFGVLAPFLQSIGLLHDLAGHGLGNIAYVLYGALAGAIAGLAISAHVVLKHPVRTKLLFSTLTATTIVIISVAFICVNFLGVNW